MLSNETIDHDWKQTGWEVDDSFFTCVRCGRRTSSRWGRPGLKEDPPCITLNELVRKAIEAFENLSPEEQRAHRREQAISFVFGQLALSGREPDRAMIAALYDEKHGGAGA